MRNRFMSIVLGIGVLLLDRLRSGAAPESKHSEQNGHRQRRPRKKPRTPDLPTTYDKHDLAGVWYGRGISILMGNPAPPMTPAGKAVFDTYKPSSGPRAVVPALGNDPMGPMRPLGLSTEYVRQRQGF